MESGAALLEGLPLQPVSLAADTGCNVGQIRQLLDERDMDAYIPIHPIQETNMVPKGGFEYRGDHLICPQGKTLRRGAFHNRDRIFQYVARQKDCQACPVRKIATAVKNIGLQRDDAVESLDAVFDPDTETGIREAYEQTVELGYDEKDATRRLQSLTNFLDRVLKEDQLELLDDEFLDRARELYDRLSQLLKN